MMKLIKLSKSRRLSNVFLAIIILLCDSCNNENCHINYNNFRIAGNAPIICITKKESNCEYLITGDFWLKKEYVHSTGKLCFEDNAFLIKINSPQTSYFRYFDFSKEVNDSYTISISSGNKLFDSFIAIIDDKIRTKDGKETYLFRIKNSFYYDQFYDIVFFVSQENGIIGSYISDVNQSIETIISPKGDILSDYIDYSKREFRRIL